MHCTRATFRRVALLALGLSLSSTAVLADDLPSDTNKIESLTPQQARKLAEEFPGVEFKKVTKGSVCMMGGCLPLNSLKTIDAATAQAFGGLGGTLLLDGLTMLDADTAKAIVALDIWDGNLSSITAFESPDSVEITAALASKWTSREMTGSPRCRAMAAIHVSLIGIGVPAFLSSSRTAP